MDIMVGKVRSNLVRVRQREVVKRNKKWKMREEVKLSGGCPEVPGSAKIGNQGRGSSELRGGTLIWRGVEERGQKEASRRSPAPVTAENVV